MKIGVMQPYFLPYIGYFQLVNEVDLFIFADDYQYTKKGWINRNRIMNQGRIEYITIPLKNDSDYLNINQRYISADFSMKKIVNQLNNSYKSSSFYVESFEKILEILSLQDRNLSHYLINSIKLINRILKIECDYMCTSDFKFKPGLRGEEKIFQICRELGASTYVNLPGGRKLYEYDRFKSHDIELKFLDPIFQEYPQKTSTFTSGLSICDLLFSDGIHATQSKHLTSYIVSVD